MVILINYEKLIESLSERQKKIYELLEISKEKSVIAYLGAIRVLNDDMNPDRYHQAANSIRHIGALITRTNQRGKQSKNPKPQQFSRKLKAFLTEETEFLHQDIIKNLEDLIDRWQNLQDKYFTPLAHYSEKNLSEFEEKFEEFENILTELLKTSKERKDILRKLLKVVNPNQGHIELLKSAILFPSDAHYFFTSLKSPNWVEILKTNGFFNDPSKEFSKHFNISSWPQANYLISISHTKSREVLKIFSEFKDFDNFLIFRRLLHCILNMPIDVARDSIQLINLWARNIMPDPELMVLQKLFIKFVNSSEFNGALRLLEIMLNYNYPKKEVENYPHYNKYYLLLTKSFGDFHDTILNMEDGDFLCKFIHILAYCLSEEIRSEITKFMRTGEVHENKKLINPELLLSKERSEIFRESIEALPDSNVSNSVMNLLIDNIRDYFLALHSQNPEIFKKCAKSFLKFKWKIFTRLFLFMLDKKFDVMKDYLSEVLERKDIFEGPQCWNEYYHLLKNHFSKFKVNQRRVIFKWIEEGPRISFLEENFPSKAEYEQVKAGYIKSWRKRRVNPIVDNLPDEFKNKFSDILTDIKNMKNPEFIRKKSGVSFYVPSDLHLKDIKDLNFEDQIDYLKNFKPDKESFPIIKNKEGLGTAYSILIKENPSKYAKLIHRFKEIPPEYLPDIVDGFKKAMEENYFSDITKFLNFCTDILNSLASIKDRDILYRTEFAIIRFIEVMLIKAPNDTIIENQDLIWSLNLLRNEVPEFTKYSDSQTFQNSPLAYYLFMINGLKLYNMIVFIELLDEILKEGEEKQFFKYFFQIIDRLLDPNLEKGELVRAIIGYRLATLLKINQSWLKERLDLIFINDSNRRNLWDVVWDSYISTHYLSGELFSLLQSQYKKGINRLRSNSRNITFEGKKNLINHLIGAYLREIVNLDEDSLIVYLFVNSDSNTRKLIWQILSNYYESINNVEDNEKRDKILNRYYELLSFRIQYLKENTRIEYRDILNELDPVGFLFSKILKFEKKHLILLNKVLELTEGNSGIFTGKILEKIKESLEVDRGLIIEILNKLAGSENQSIWLDERTSDIIFDIVAIMKSKEISEKSENMIIKIGEAMWRRGFYKFSDYHVTSQ